MSKTKNLYLTDLELRYKLQTSEELPLPIAFHHQVGTIEGLTKSAALLKSFSCNSFYFTGTDPIKIEQRTDTLVKILNTLVESPEEFVCPCDHEEMNYIFTSGAFIQEIFQALVYDVNFGERCIDLYQLKDDGQLVIVPTYIEFNKQTYRDIVSAITEFYNKVVPVQDL